MESNVLRPVLVKSSGLFSSTP